MLYLQCSLRDYDRYSSCSLRGYFVQSYQPFEKFFSMTTSKEKVGYLMYQQRHLYILILNIITKMDIQNIIYKTLCSTFMP